MNWLLAFFGRNRFSWVDAIWVIVATVLLSKGEYGFAALTFILGIPTSVVLYMHAKRYDRWRP